MNDYLTMLSRVSLLLTVVLFCCGFGWGLGNSDPCVEARTTVDTLTTITDLTKRAKLEETILKACPNGAAGLFVKAQLAERGARTDSAMALYREALTKDSTIAEAHGNLGLLLRERRNDDEATVELTRGLMGKADPRYHRALADIMRKGPFPALVLFHYTEALKTFPDDVDIHIGCAEAYVQLGQLDKAEEEFFRLTAIKPTETRIILGLAEVYRKDGRLERAVKGLRSYRETRKGTVSWLKC
jgi:Flp pilus assembly protein TadD